MARPVVFLDGPIAGEVHEVEGWTFHAVRPRDYAFNIGSGAALPVYGVFDDDVVTYTVRRVQKIDHVSGQWTREAHVAAVDWATVERRHYSEMDAAIGPHWRPVGEVLGGRGGDSAFGRVTANGGYGSTSPGARPRPMAPPSHPARAYWCGAEGCWYVKQGYKRCDPGECVQAGKGYRHG